MNIIIDKAKAKDNVINIVAGTNKNTSVNKNITTDVNKNITTDVNKNITTGVNKNITTDVNKNITTGVNKNITTGVNKNITTGVNKNITTGNTNTNNRPIYPDWVLKCKETNREIRYLQGKYYLYQITSKYNPEKKRAQKITIAYLGRITENGLIPKGDKQNKTKKLLLNNNINYNVNVNTNNTNNTNNNNNTNNTNNSNNNNNIGIIVNNNANINSNSGITTKEYGVTKFITNNMKDVIERLSKYFPEFYKEIIVIALFRLLHQSPLKNMNIHFESSFLSELYSNISLHPDRVSSLLNYLGRNRELIVNFCREDVRDNEYILFDITNIHSNSKTITDAKIGYNSKRDFNPQINLMMIFSQSMKEPIFYSILKIILHQENHLCKNILGV
jgi:hypothetical protein